MKAAKTKTLIAILATFIPLLPLPLFGQDWQSQVKKTWQFKPKQGVVKIALLVDPVHPKVSSLDILYENDAQPSLAEEVGFIREVLHQLPELGIDLYSLRAISMRGFAEPEVRERLAIAALHSKAWRSPAKVTGGAERVVEDLLNSLGVYNAFNSAFEEYGLVVRARGVEKVADAKCSDVRIRDRVCKAHPSSRVPVGANLYIAIEKK